MLNEPIYHYMKLLTLLAFLTFSISLAQNPDVLSWINSNAITIEDANPDTPLTAFAQNVPQKFKDTRIFGFGEATHNTKEFFDLKAKFFKYLVKEQGVRIFIMEESYYNAYVVNEWLAGGEGDARTLAGKLGFAIWRCEEVAGLLQWMKEYNHDKPHAKQIRFYGMDDQFGYMINTQIRSFVKEANIKIDENLLIVADSCSASSMVPKPKKEWSADKQAKLKLLRQAIVNQKSNVSVSARVNYEEILHAIDVLQEYIIFIGNPSQIVRDNDMYENVKWIMQHEGENSKAFIWAHNAHINKQQLDVSKEPSVGTRLKEYFGTTYYSIGFDFGKGQLYGVEKQGKIYEEVAYKLEEPYKNTYAALFVKADADVFFIDIQQAVANRGMAKFLSSNKKQLSTGGGGYNPKYPYLKKYNYVECYDAVIFVRNVSIPKYITEKPL